MPIGNYQTDLGNVYNGVALNYNFGTTGDLENVPQPDIELFVPQIWRDNIVEFSQNICKLEQIKTRKLLVHTTSKWIVVIDNPFMPSTSNYNLILQQSRQLNNVDRVSTVGEVIQPYKVRLLLK